MDFNVKEQEEFTDIVSGSTLQLAFKKPPPVKFFFFF